MRCPKSLLAVAAIAIAACGSTPTSSSRPTPTPMPTSTPTPTARPTATPLPDTLRVDVVSTGVGVYQAVVVPVAVVRNAASRTGVSGVSVHFSLSRSGRALPGLDSPAVTLYPGQTLALTADCTDACNNTGSTAPPDTVAVTIVGGAWGPPRWTPLMSTATSLTCVSGCGGGQGQWDVVSTVGSHELTQGTRVDLSTWCSSASGALVGASPPRVIQWPQTGGTLSLTLHAIVSRPPSTCQVGASASV